ncbi:MAG: tRNA (N6-isopentenyl adenosine(37)-C2)-methylthiotransferase MiaB [bacterium]|nr:tRNA (N6-isopentenyl adenosine(37)-C2)-methylthiotransferase MiaB [bacterium]
MNDRSVYLETMGCQMNVLDSELVLGQLRARGYTPTDDMHAADLVLVNTCSVRRHAEDKALSRLGSLKLSKKSKPDRVIGVIGCMAERDPDGIFEKVPHVDLVCGPAELYKVPAMVEEVQAGRNRLVALTVNKSRRSTPLERATEHDSVESLDLSRDPRSDGSSIQAYVRVQRGCDKFCTFCVVPFTRGPERSRPPDLIVDEVRMLADRGCKEITLLGQTVNSYVNQDGGRPVNFAELLERVHVVEGIERIRFVTSYPGDFTSDIFDAMRDLPKVCAYLHLPVQSGSNAVLERMRRQHTVERFRELIDQARQTVPGITIATDFIVGFSGETDEEFEESCELVRRSNFKNIFCFKYSERPATVAEKRMPDDVPDAVKRQRNRTLLELQEEVAMANNQTLLGRTVEVLVEGYSKAAIKAQEAEQTRGSEVGWKRSDQLVGRTPGDQIVVFTGKPEDIGRLAQVRLTGATALTLHGELADREARPS